MVGCWNKWLCQCSVMLCLVSIAMDLSGMLLFTCWCVLCGHVSRDGDGLLSD